MMRKKGQTLLEVIITLSVISIALISLQQLVISSYAAGTTARRQGYATYLAQESADIVTNIRDTSAFLLSAGDSSITRWNQKLTYCDTAVPTCNPSGYYSLGMPDTKTGWALNIMRTDSSLPCYNCASPPIYSGNTYTADWYYSPTLPGLSHTLDGTKGITDYPGTTFYRYIYIQKYNNDPNTLRARIIVSWREGSRIQSVGQDILLTNLLLTGYLP